MVCLSDHRTDYSSYAWAVRLGRPSGDATVYELFGRLMVLSIFWPLGIFLLLRYRVVQAVLEGYRSG